jgi:hypothetical protein
VLSSAACSSILAGSNIIASVANTAYVPQLNISTLVGTPAVNTLGIDASGFVVATTTPTDYFLTGLTFNNGTYDLTAEVNDGNSYTVNLGILSGDMVVTGGTYDINTGVVTFTNNSGGTFNVSGFVTGYTDVFLTGASYNSGTGVLTLTNTDGSTVTASGLDACCLTGGTLDYSNGNLVLDTNSGQITIPGLQDIFLSAVTYDNNTGILNLTMNDLTAFNVGPFQTVDSFVTGGSYSNGVLTIGQNGNGQTITIPGFPIQDYYVTGGTYDSNTGILTLDRNGNGSATVNIGSISSVMVAGTGTGSTLRSAANNQAQGQCSFVIGANNTASSSTNFSSILGGSSNVLSASALGSSIAGGFNNNIAVGVINSFVGGGNSNITTGTYSAIVGGVSNRNESPSGIIGGGCSNTSSGNIDVIVGGRLNRTSSGYQYQSILGGLFNTVSGNNSSILGGTNNTITKCYSSISNGCANIVNGVFSTVNGGQSNTINADYTSAVGRANIVSCVCSHVIGNNITTDRTNTLFINNLSIMNIPDETTLPLPTGSVYKCSTNGQLYIV